MSSQVIHASDLFFLPRASFHTANATKWDGMGCSYMLASDASAKFDASEKNGNIIMLDAYVRWNCHLKNVMVLLRSNQ